MIVFVQGEIVRSDRDSLVIQMGNAGIKVYVPVTTARQSRSGEVIFLHTHLVVREDGWSLYGFETETERDFFILLLGVNGVGPRMALAILSTLSVENIRQAVISEQAEMFARVPGVGKRTAQKILLHLQGKVGEGGPLQQAVGLLDVDLQVLEALTALGYSVVEAQSAIQSLPRDASEDVEERLRLALQYFSR
ncbi:MAG: Holliday junction ATP-dependent DNA helicase RuvA [Bellilinea sp.]|nr:MAG: Holliday junction ATP-dependent DNA helicase RuvA [Bellilinea sp.]